MRSCWRDRALCAAFPGLPWVLEPERVPESTRRSMVVVCAACPVFADCVAEVRASGVTAGFWAGPFRHDPAELELGGVA